MAANDLGSILKRIDKRLEAVELTDRAASKASGMSADYIRSMRRQWNSFLIVSRGGRLKKRDPKPQESTSIISLNKLARPLETTGEWLMSEIGPENVTEAKERVRAAREVKENYRAKRVKGATQLATVPVIGAVAAGVWSEIDGADNIAVGFENEIQVEIPAAPGYPLNQQHAAAVRSNAINRVANRGDFLIVLGVAESGARPRNGDLVVVMRTKDNLMEISAKRYVVASDEKSVELRYDSVDPKFGNQISMTVPLSAAGILGDKADDGSAVTIKGIVLGIYRLP